MININKRINVLTKFLLIIFSGVLISTGCFAQKNDKSKQIKDMENSNGTTVTLHGAPFHTNGKLPVVGSNVKDFTLTDVSLTEKTLKDYSGKYIIMNIFPSVNTGVCAKSVRKFNEEASALNNTVVLCISKDLPFAQKAFCGAEGIENVVMLSDFRNDFGKENGVLLTDGPMKGLLSRAIIVVNPEGKIIYTQQVPEIGEEPDYTKAIGAIK